MRVRIGVALGAVAALVFAALAVAAPSPYKVTGGGQVFVSSSVGEDGKPTVKGPGDTITFQAFIDGQGAGNATGQVNIIDRVQDGGGQSTSGKGVHYRGEVQCAFLASDPASGGGYAELHGTAKATGDDTSHFIVRILDNGQGAAAEPDQVEFDLEAASPNCDDHSEGDDFQYTLARGNAKIHKENAGASKRSRSGGGSTSTQSVTRALSLR